MTEDTHQPGQLKRQLGLFHAVLLGLGSILGTGVFVSIGIAAGIAGPAVLIAIVLAALLALCNGLSSAQLAAAHPVAGGTYEYGYKFLHPKLGFTAGWMFLLAKSASAATAALAVAITFLDLTQLYGDQYDLPITTWAIASVTLVTLAVLVGIRRSVKVNAMLVIVTIGGLLLFTFASLNAMHNNGTINEVIKDIFAFRDVPALIAAVPLMFVAFTGYGRIATLGEEVHNPRRVIPRAIVLTLFISLLLYASVGFVLGEAFAQTYAFLSEMLRLGAVPEQSFRFLEERPLIFSAQRMELPVWLINAVSISAITAMLGVLLNLVLGLSRVLLAMGRRRDVPGVFAKVNDAGTTPVPAVIGVGVLIAGLTLLGDVKTTWSFAAFTVLIYYGITNLAALRLPVENRLYPRGFAWAGLGGCLFLAWWVQPVIWLVGCGLIVLGLVWHQLAPKMFGPPPAPDQRCVVCGYDLRASTGSCPECGTPIPTNAKPSCNATTDES